MVPPYHIAGISALMSSIYAGRRIVMLPSFEPEAWLRLVDEERVSNAFVVPTMLTRIIAAIDSQHRRRGLSACPASIAATGQASLR